MIRKTENTSHEILKQSYIKTLSIYTSVRQWLVLKGRGTWPFMPLRRRERRETKKKKEKLRGNESD